MRRISRAIFSCHNKLGLVDFARTLRSFKVDIISTEGTQRTLAAGGIESTEVAAYTGVRELLGGRVKSLHPKVHAGLLGLRDNKVHQEEMNTFAYPWVDLLAVNLHHIEDIVKTPGITVDEVIEQVDIGGIAMIRSAAKNFRYVAVATNPGHYPLLVHEMQAHEGGISFAMRFRLAKEAFTETARYDRLLAEWLERSEPPKE